MEPHGLVHVDGFPRWGPLKRSPDYANFFLKPAAADRQSGCEEGKQENRMLPPDYASPVIKP